jgi:hypothetical protein
MEAVMTDRPKLPKAIHVSPPKPVHIPTQDERTLPSNNPIGSFYNRLATRQQTKEIEANTELKQAQAKNIAADSEIMDAHTGRLRSYAQMKDAKIITDTDAAHRETSYLNAQEELQAAHARANPQPVPIETGHTSGSQSSQFASEIESEFEFSKADQIRIAAEQKIMKILGGMPEESATQGMKAVIEKIRQTAETMIKDGGLE